MSICDFPASGVRHDGVVINTLQCVSSNFVAEKTGIAVNPRCRSSLLSIFSARSLFADAHRLDLLLRLPIIATGITVAEIGGCRIECNDLRIAPDDDFGCRQPVITVDNRANCATPPADHIISTYFTAGTMSDRGLLIPSNSSDSSSSAWPGVSAAANSIQMRRRKKSYGW